MTKAVDFFKGFVAVTCTTSQLRPVSHRFHFLHKLQTRPVSASSALLKSGILAESIKYLHATSARDI